MRSICATLLMLLVAKEGSCRHPGRTVPWPALIGPEVGMPAMASNTQQIPDKMPEPPKRLRRDRRFAPWELAELPMLAGVKRRPVPASNMHKVMHDATLRRDRRFAPWAQQTVAQMPMPGGMPPMPSGGMPPMPSGGMPGGMPPMPSGGMPQMPSGRKRRSPKDGKKDGKKKKEKEQKPEVETEDKPEEKPQEKPEEKGKPK